MQILFLTVAFETGHGGGSGDF